MVRRNPRRRLEVDERKAQLLELGRRVFAERSYDEVSIDEIAEQAGISKGLLYHYFKSKREYYVATVEQASDEMIAMTTPDPDQTHLEQVEQGVRNYLDYVQTNAESYAALLRSGVGVDTQVQAIVERSRVAFVELMLGRLGPMLGNRPIIRTAVRGWVGFAEASSLDWIAHRQISYEQMTRMLVHALFHLLPFQDLVDAQGNRMPTGAEVYAAFWGKPGATADAGEQADGEP